MQVRVRCDCGDEIVSDETAELLTRARRHAIEAHGMDVPPERILALVEPYESSTELLREPTGGGV
jgi:predicted small metal-binding protein